MDDIHSQPEKKKRKPYKPTGWGTVFAYLFSVLYLVGIPVYVAPALWPKQIESELTFYFWMILGVHTAVILICNITMYYIYTAESEFFERYKIHEFEWPWNVNKEKWIEFLKRSAKIVFFNHFILVPAILLLNIWMTNIVPLRTDYESLPSLAEVLLHMAIYMVIEDFGFYWGHRFLHWKPIYPYIHKIHHEYKNTISIAVEHAHPLEFVIGNIMPTNLGTLLLQRRCHLLTTLLFVTFRIVKATEAHSGYQFTWSPILQLPFQIPSDYHNYHHSAGFNNNYGSTFRVWDTLCGTTSSDYENIVKEKNRQLNELYGEKKSE